MKQKRIKLALEEITSHVAEHCEAVSVHFSEDTIHEFRVSVKMLRAVLRLHRAYSGNKKLRISTRLKTLYDLAGVIRESQLELKVLAACNADVPSYTTYLEQTIARKKAEWLKVADPDIFRKLRRKLNNADYEAMPAEYIGTFLKNNVAAAADILGVKNPSDHSIHRSRRLLKDVLHLIKFCKHHWKAAERQTKQLPVQQLSKLAEATGRYNDARMRLKHLSSFVINPALAEEVKHMEKLRSEEAAKLTAAKRKLLASARLKMKKISETSSSDKESN